jgi:hypothetical protein
VSETGSELAVQTAIVGPTVLSRATGLKLTLPPGERAVVSVRDATGREVVKPTPFSATGRLDFGSRPAGVYLVQVGPPGRARTLKVLYLGD